MKFRSVFIFALLFTSLFRAQSDTPILRYWNGGELNFQLNFGLNVMGGGMGSGSFGRVIAPGISSGPAAIFTNPAEIALLKNPNIFFDTKFGISNKTFGLDYEKDLNKNISSSTTDFLKDTTTFIFSKDGARTDTKIGNFGFSQTGNFGAFALGVPVYEKIVLGFGVYYPIDIRSNFLMTGIRMKMESTKQVSDQEFAIDLPLSTSFVSEFAFRVNTMTAGLAGEVFNSSFGKTNVGFALTRYEVNEYININMLINGYLAMNQTKEYHFNDPNDPTIDRSLGQTNDFFYRLKGDYKTDAWGYRFGVVQSSESWNLVMALDIVPEFSMSDPNAFTESYQPKFLTGTLTGEGDNALNILIDSLDLANPNLTVPTKNEFTKDIKTIYPSTFSIGGDVKWGSFWFGLNFVKYLNEFSFEYGKYKIGKNLNFAVKSAVQVQLADKVKGASWLLIPFRVFCLDFDGMLFQLFGGITKYKNPTYRVESGLLVGDGIAEGFSPKDKKSYEDIFGVPLPTGFAIIREYTLFDNLRIGATIFGLPDFAIRYGLSFDL